MTDLNRELKYRLCSASGTYPAQSYYTKNAALLVNQKIIVTIWDSNNADSERVFNTALLLATNSKKGFLKLYGLPFTHEIEANLDNELLGTVQESILSKVANKTVANGDILPEFDCYQNAKGASLPLILSGMPYSKAENLIDDELLQKISNALEQSSDDELLYLADLLITSGKLSCHFQFQTEANHYLLMAVEKVLNLDWLKSSPLMLDWQNRISKETAHEVALKMSPIEYIKLFNSITTSLRTGYLNKIQ